MESLTSHPSRFLTLCVFIATLVSVAECKVQFMGMNIAGFDFGCQIDVLSSSFGTCPLSSIQPPTSVGPKQMKHFVNDDQMNIFRFPVSWQFLTNNNAAAPLDTSNFGKYDSLMQSCLQTGSYCAIDIHNFARFNGEIIGQGGPSDDQFATLWSQLANKYANNDKVIFGLMNEPHDVDINAWANSCQAAVTAIRQAGATNQMILLPGNNFTSAGAFIENGSGAALLKVTNPDGTTDGLVMDLHKYLDVDNSGEHNTCTTDNTADAFQPVADFLRQNGRVAMVSETGAGKDSSVSNVLEIPDIVDSDAVQCFTDFCSQNNFLNQNSDVYLGYIAWAAGSFDSSYVLSLTPTIKNGKLVDAPLAAPCVVAPFQNAGPATFVSSSAASVTSSGSTSGAPSLTQTSSAPKASSQTSAPLAASRTILSASETSETSTSSSGVATSVAGTTMSADGTASTTMTSGQNQFTGGAQIRTFASEILTAGILVAAMIL